VISANLSLKIPASTKRKGLDWKEIDRIYTQFTKADTNNSGTISFDEMTVVFQRVVPELDKSQYAHEFNKIDKNKSGYVDFMEFLAWIELHNIPVSLGRTKSSRNVIDMPHTGSDRYPRRTLERTKKSQTIKLRSPRYSLTTAMKPIQATKELRADAFRAFAAYLIPSICFPYLFSFHIYFPPSFPFR
jgi:hypothetical protein